VTNLNTQLLACPPQPGGRDTTRHVRSEEIDTVAAAAASQ
jgi:hypothetical protein